MRAGARCCYGLAFIALFGCTRPSPVRERLDSQPRRIAVLAPAAAEMLEALGALDRVVAVGDFVTLPAALDELPRLGPYHAPNVERILALEADLLVTAASEAAAPVHQRLESLGVDVLALDTSTYDGVFSSLSQLGQRLGAEERARALAASLREQLRAIEQQARGLPERRVLFVVGRDPLFVAGPGSHIDEMIALAGGRNVAHDALAPYQRVSLESVLSRRPEVIIDTSDNRPAVPRGRRLGDWERWPFLPAVERRQVYSVDPSRLVIPGVRLPQMTLLLARLIHPETFGEPGPEELGPPATDGGPLPATGP